MILWFCDIMILEDEGVCNQKIQSEIKGTSVAAAP